MSYLLMLVSLLAASSSAFAAADCSNDAYKIAKMNLDQVAKKYGFKSSALDSKVVGPVTSMVVDAQAAEVWSKYAFNGSVYKSSYKVSVTVDDLCAVRVVKINEVK